MTAITLDLHSIVDLTDEQFTSSAKPDRYQIRAQSQRGIDCDATNWLEDWKPEYQAHNVWQTGLIRMEPELPSTPLHPS